VYIPDTESGHSDGCWQESESSHRHWTDRRWIHDGQFFVLCHCIKPYVIGGSSPSCCEGPKLSFENFAATVTLELLKVMKLMITGYSILLRKILNTVQLRNPDITYTEFSDDS